jgi:predicted dehydrogenase
MDRIRFGVLSTAKIGIEKVIPAMQAGEYTKVTAIASRDRDRAARASESLGISKSYSSYEELLGDPDIDAVYIPLPNHLHVPWSIKALEAGKHVLCEKPIGLNAGEAQRLIDMLAKYPDLKVMEAFMYRHHPRWVRTKSLIDEGRIGSLKSIHSFFTYYKDDPDNIRFKPGMGGGGLMDVGCYNISLSRFLFDKNPDQVQSITKFHPEYDVDVLSSGLLDFNTGTSTFTCSMQCAGLQHVQIMGTTARIEMNMPFNPPVDRETELYLYSGDTVETIRFEPCNQFTIQGDLFAKAILEDTDVPTPLEDAKENMKILDQILNSD